MSSHFKHFHLNSPLKTTPCHPQGCSHNLAVISANICRYSSALSAQQREVVSRSRSLQIRWHKNTSDTSPGRANNWAWIPDRTAEPLLFLSVFTRNAFYICRIKCSDLPDSVGKALGLISDEVRFNWNHRLCSLEEQFRSAGPAKTSLHTIDTLAVKWVLFFNFIIYLYIYF